MAIGGKAKPVYIVSEEEVASGTFKVEQGPAIRVHGMDTEDLVSTDRGATGGNLQPVYIVEEGERRIAGGKAILVTDAISDRGVVGHTATPIFVVNLWPDPVEYLSGTTATGGDLCLSVAHPSPFIVNDFLIAEVVWDGGVDGAAGTITTPAGWTVIYEEWEAGQGWLQVAWKLVTTPAPAEFEWCFSVAGDAAIALSMYRCVDILDPIDSVGGKKGGNDNQPNNDGVVTGKEYTKLLMFVAASGSPTIVPPDGWTERADVGGASKSDKKNKGKGNSGGSGDGTLSAAANWQSVIVAIAPCTGIPSTVTVRLTWDDNASDETGYYVERSFNGVDFAQVADIVANSVTWDDEGVETGQTVWYRVRAYNDDGNSGYSNTASVAAA